MNQWRYFNLNGFDKILVDTDPQLISMADVARGLLKVPLVAISAKRGWTENEAAGGSKTSSHLKGCAIDWRCGSIQDALEMVWAFRTVGIKRIGLNYKQLDNGKLKIRGIHTDNDTAKPDGMWSKIYNY